MSLLAFIESFKARGPVGKEAEQGRGIRGEKRLASPLSSSLAPLGVEITITLKGWI